MMFIYFYFLIHLLVILLHAYLITEIDMIKKILHLEGTVRNKRSVLTKGLV